MADVRSDAQIIASFYINGIIKPFVFWSTTRSIFFVAPNEDTAQAFAWFRLAQTAMRSVVEASLEDESVRQIVAANGLFEFLLTTERRGIADQIAELVGSPVEMMATSASQTLMSSLKSVVTGVPQALVDEAMAIGSGERRPLRQILLDAIYDARAGGIFKAEDETGVTTWIQSEAGSMSAIGQTIEFDQAHAFAVCANALRVVADLTIPMGWVRSSTPLPGASPIQSPLHTAVSNFRAGVLSLDLNVLARAGLAGKADNALSRLTRDSVGSASSGLPTLRLPDGREITLSAGSPRAWYQSGRVWAGAVVGAVLGAWYALKRKA